MTEYQKSNNIENKNQLLSYCNEKFLFIYYKMF